MLSIFTFTLLFKAILTSAEVTTSPDFFQAVETVDEDCLWKKKGWGGYGGGYTTIGNGGSGFTYGSAGGDQGGFTSSFTSYFTQTISGEPVTSYFTVPGGVTTIYQPSNPAQVTTLYTLATSIVTVYGNGNGGVSQGAGSAYTTSYFTRTIGGGNAPIGTPTTITTTII